MLTWTEREDAQKNAPTTGRAVGANAAEVPVSDFDARVPGSDKRIATLAAKFALLGLELNCVRREGRQRFEVGDHTGTYAVTTEADLNGLLVRFGGAA